MHVDRLNTLSNKGETNFAYDLEQKVNSHRLLNILRSFPTLSFVGGSGFEELAGVNLCPLFQCYIAYTNFHLV